MVTPRDTPEAVLAAVLHRRFHDHWGNLTPDEVCEADAAAILAALDGWTLVPGGGDVIARGIELARQQAAEIERLRAALERRDDELAAHHLGLTLSGDGPDKCSPCAKAHKVRAALAPSEP
jgi:hypothetical protein